MGLAVDSCYSGSGEETCVTIRQWRTKNPWEIYLKKFKVCHTQIKKKHTKITQLCSNPHTKIKKIYEVQSNICIYFMEIPRQTKYQLAEQ